MTEIYVPVVGEILHLTAGTPIRVKRIDHDLKYFVAGRADGELFTQEQAEKYRDAAWQFDGQRGMNDSWPSIGMPFVLPNSKQALEQKVKQLGGTVTWTDPDLIKAREIWARRSRPNGGPESQYVLDGHSDNGAVIQAILEAIKSN